MNAWEDYVYPETNVLRNKADIRDQGELQRFERGVTAVRIQELKEKPVEGDFGLKHLQDIHRQIFRDVYEWAGEVRTVDIAKGPASDRTVFTLKEDIPLKAELLQVTIEEANRLRGLDKRAFAETMGEVYAAANDLHPFREGNGRATREYMSQLAAESGHTLHYERVGKQQWNEAAKLSAKGDLQPIKDVFYEITTVERAVAFDKVQTKDGQREALGQHPELDGAFKRLYETQRAGGDMDQVRAEVSRELHEGRLVTGSVTAEESRKVIDHAAAYRGLMIRDADRLGGTFRGEVVAVSSHHAMLQVGDMVAVRYERSNLDRDVHVGERLAIQYGRDGSQVYDRGQEPPRDRGRETMQMERERTLAGG